MCRDKYSEICIDKYSEIYIDKYSILYSGMHSVEHDGMRHGIRQRRAQALSSMLMEVCEEQKLFLRRH